MVQNADISEYGGANGNFIKQIIEASVRSGDELKDIQEIVDTFIGYKDFPKEVNEFRDSLRTPEGDSDKELKDVSDILDELKKKYPQLTSVIDSFYQTVLKGGENAANAESDSLDNVAQSLDKIQSAYDTVSSAISEYNEQGFLSVDTIQSLLELNDDYLMSMIDENGQLVLNTKSFENLAIAKLKNLQATKISEFNDWVTTLANEGSTAEEVAKKYIKVASAKELAMGSITTGYTDRNGNLVDLTQTDIYKKLLADMQMIESALNGISSGGLSKSSDKNLKAKKDYAKKVKEINEDLAEKEEKFAEDMSDAWKKEHLEQLKDNLAERKDIIERYAKSLETIDFGLGIIDEKDFDTKSALLSNQIEQSTAYAKALKEEFQRVKEIVPETADEAQELASRLEEIGSSMRSNAETMRSSMIEVSRLRIDVLSSINKDISSALNKELSSFDKRLELLNKSNPRSYDYDADAYKYTKSLLKEDVFLPTLSDFEKQRNKRQRQDRQLISDTKKTQDEINKIVSDAAKMQSDENAKAREKERQNLIRDMEKARKEAKEKLDEAKADLNDNMKQSEAIVNTSLSNIENQFANAKFETPAVDTSKTEKSLEDFQTKLIQKYGYGTIPAYSGMPNSGNNFVEYAKGFAGSNGKNVSNKNTGETLKVDNNGAWCAEFIRDTARMLGIKNDVIPNTYSVQGMMDFFKNQGRFYSASDIIPQVGDIGIAKKGKVSHVVIVTGYNPETKEVFTIEGNTTSPNTKYKGTDLSTQFVMEKSRPLSYFTGFGRPAYANGTPYHPGGLAILGDEGKGKYEAAVLPDDTVHIIGRNGTELVDLPRGTQVIPHDETKKIFGTGNSINGKKIPKYAEGIGFKNVTEDIQATIDKYEGKLEYLNNWFGRQYAKLYTNLNEDIQKSEVNKTLETMLERDIRLKKNVDDLTNLDIQKLEELAESQSKLYEDIKKAHDEYYQKTDSGEWLYDSNIASELDNLLAEALEGVMDKDTKIEESKLNRTERYKEIFENRLKESEDYIANQELLGWENGDSEVEARRRVLEWIESDYYHSLIEDDAEYYKILLEHRNNYYESIKKESDEAITNIERYRERVRAAYDEENKEYDRLITKENALLNLKSKSFDMTNKLASAQHEADKAIAASRISKQYLTSDEYKLIYNEEDYNKISDKIEEIYSDTTALTKRFNKEIADAYDNEQYYLIESITDEYERQLDIKERELEITQAEVDLVKKKQQLENVLAERNVRQMVERDGKLQWEWVADTDKVRQATEELADAQYKINESETQRRQQLILNAMQSNIDGWNNSKAANDYAMELLDEAITNLKLRVEDFYDPIDDLSLAVTTFEKTAVPSISRAANDLLETFEKVTKKNYDRITVPDGKFVKVNPDGKAPKGLSKGTIVQTAGGNYLITDVNKNGSYKSVRTHYARGTKSAAKGLAEVNEDTKYRTLSQEELHSFILGKAKLKPGDESYISKDGTFHGFAGGETVFSAAQTQALWDISKNLTDKIQAPPIDIQKLKGSEDNSVTLNGDIVVQNPADFNDFTRQLTNAFRKKSV